MSAQDLIEERVARLNQVVERRNELLREMYWMIQRRNDIGNVLAMEEDEDEEGLSNFLRDFDIEKNLETGSIVNLPAYDSEEWRQGKWRISSSSEAIHSSPSPSSHNLKIEEDDNDIPSLRDSHDGQQDVRANSSRSPSRPSSRKRMSIPKGVLKAEPHEESPPSPLSEDGAGSNKYYDANDDISNASASVSMEVDAHLKNLEDVQMISSGSTLLPNESRTPLAAMIATSVGPAEPALGPEQLSMSISVDLASHTNDKEGLATPLGSASFASPSTYHATVAPQQPTPETPQFVRPPLLIKTPSAPTINLAPYTFSTPPAAPSSHDVASVASTISNNEGTASVVHQPSSGAALPAIAPPSTPVKITYTLPPINTLPAEFNHKGKPGKKRRDKGSDGSASGNKRDDWVPMGINKWGAVLRANPVHKRLSQATKCLSSRDWNIAYSELKFLRTLERVETLKQEGHWSFRQPKKQRGVGGLMKTHRDYLLDEMKLIRADFREERKWKIALAYKIGRAVLAWHAAGSLEERANQGICVLWKRPKAVEGDQNGDENDDAGANEDGQVDRSLTNVATTQPPKGVMAMIDYGSDDDDDDDNGDGDNEEVVDALQTENVLNEALEDAEENRQPKIEEIDDDSGLRVPLEQGRGERGEHVNVENQQTGDNSQIDAQTNSKSGLKDTSNDPVLGAHPSSFQNQSTSGNASSQKPAVYDAIRERIAYSEPDDLFLDLDLIEGMSKLSTDDASTIPSDAFNLSSADLTAIFPDVQPLGLLDVAPSPFEGGSKKKGEKRSDRDDPNKRTEDTTYTRLAPITRFMYTKPTLLGALQPGKHWINGAWVDFERESPIAVDYETPLRVPEEPSNELFENLRHNAQNQIIPTTANKDKDPRKRTNEHIWTVAEDTLLKSLVERYPNNWTLVADAFNSSRVTLSIDRRTPSECSERYMQRWSTAPRAPVQSEVIESPTPNQMTTRGVKRTANASVAVNSTSSDAIKRRRHNLMVETLRKIAKKREAAQKANAVRKATGVHDTHGQYANLPKMTPEQLSRLKAEREAREAEARRNSHSQQLLLREAQHRMQGQVPILQSPPPGNGVVRAGGQGIPQVQGIPSIRGQNISQQQRMPNQMNVQNAHLVQAAQAQAQVQARVAAQTQAAAQQQQQAQAQQGVPQQQPQSAAVVGQPVVNGTPHMSLPTQRPTSSAANPHLSPLQVSAEPARPSSVQPQQAQMAQMAASGAAMNRGAMNINHYFPTGPTGSQLYSQEAVTELLKQNLLQSRTQQQQMQAQVLTQAQASTQAQNQTYPSG